MTTYDIKPTSEAVRIPKWGKGAVLKVWAAALPMAILEELQTRRRHEGVEGPCSGAPHPKPTPARGDEQRLANLHPRLRAVARRGGTRLHPDPLDSEP
jgi:hypothetical protein